MSVNQFVCRVRKCPDAIAERKFKAQGLTSHYRYTHNDMAEGQRQIKIQRKMMGVDLPPVPVVAEERIVFDETGEPELPLTKDVLGAVADQLESADAESIRISKLAETNIEQYLDEHKARLEAQMASVHNRLEEAQFEYKRLQEELTRVVSARKAYAMEVQSHKPKGPADLNPDPDDRGEY